MSVLTPLAPYAGSNSRVSRLIGERAMKDVLQLEDLAGIYPKLRRLEFVRRALGEATAPPSNKPRTPEKAELLRRCRYAILFRRNLKQTVIDGKPVLIITF